MECLFLLEGNNLIIPEPEDWIKIERKLTSIGLFCYKYIFTIYTKDIFTVLFCLVIKEYCFCIFQTILCIIFPLNVSFRWKFFFCNTVVWLVLSHLGLGPLGQVLVDLVLSRTQRASSPVKKWWWEVSRKHFLEPRCGITTLMMKTTSMLLLSTVT